MNPYRLGTFNTLFGGHGDAGFEGAERWDGQGHDEPR